MTSMAQDDVRGAFEFRSGAQRGARFTLYPTRLHYEARNCSETIQLHAVGAVRVAVERHARKLGWGVVLALAALVLIAVAPPLASLAGGAADNVRSQLQQNGGNAAHGLAAMLIGVLQFLHAAANLLPVLAALLGLWAIAWLLLGWIGSTTLTLALGAVERSYRVRGRDALLLDFAESLNACVGQLGR